ncbi:MAG: hypothetical protein EBZ44_05880 [Verrucomicrobia bacterium]|nr:hypothetical protein [Verrucomicrobiota bacterium]
MGMEKSGRGSFRDRICHPIQPMDQAPAGAWFRAFPFGDQKSFSNPQNPRFRKSSFFLQNWVEKKPSG